jgi:hypothetical protein
MAELERKYAERKLEQDSARKDSRYIKSGNGKGGTYIRGETKRSMAPRGRTIVRGENT